MAVNGWEAIKVRYCDHVKRDVALEAEKVYPSEHLPEHSLAFWGIAVHLGFIAARITELRASGLEQILHLIHLWKKINTLRRGSYPSLFKIPVTGSDQKFEAM